MKDERANELPQDKDRHLDIPSESNREKHINFLDVEDNSGGNSGNRKDKETEERQRQWQEGLEEGKRARNEE